MTSQFPIDAQDAQRELGGPVVVFSYQSVACGRLYCAQLKDFFDSNWTPGMMKSHRVKIESTCASAK